MEGPGSHPMSSDYKTQVALIAAGGNKPEDWKEYIDMVKARAEWLEETRRNRMIAKMYFNAFKVIPDTCKTLAHAQLLIDYADFKSLHDLNEAEKLLSYGRRNLRHFAVIHIASAELELKRGNKEKALRILQRAPSVGAEPLSALNQALHRLNEGKTRLLSDSTKESTPAHNLSASSGRESSEELSTQFSGTFGQKKESLKQALPNCKTDTQEVQQGLDLLTQYHTVPKSLPTASVPSTSVQKLEHQPKHQQINQSATKLSWPEPPVLLSSQFLDLHKALDSQKDGSKHSLAPNQHPAEPVPQTPASQRPLLAVNHEYSSAKKGLSHYYSTPDMRSTLGSAMKGSIGKSRPLNLVPPRRVKVNPDLKKWLDEDNHNSTKDITLSSFEPLCSPPKTAPVIHESSSQFASEPMEVEATPATQNSRLSNRPNTHSAISKGQDNLHPPSVSANSALSNKISPNTNNMKPPALLLSGVKYTQPHSRLPLGEVEPKGKENAGNFHKNGESVLESSKKVDLDTIPEVRSVNSVSALQPVSNRHSSEQGHLDQKMKAESETTREIVLKQEETIRQLHQLLQQKQLFEQQQKMQEQIQQQQQHQPVGMAGATYAVNTKQPALASTITPAKTNGEEGQKIIYVNNKAYTVMRLIGRGGSAKVYQVYDPETNMIRALKCVHLKSGNSVILEGYKSEIDLLKKLQHCDRVIKLFDSEYAEQSKKLLVVLEYGETDLDKFIAQNVKDQKELHPITVCYFWFQMVTAVHAMHREGVIHSDLKPANFMLVSGNVKLIDFGIANSLQQDCTSLIKENIVGTPSYMSPEALMASNANPNDPKPKYKVGVRSDVWSLGCILYQMVYGRTPFQHLVQKLGAIVNPNHAISFPDKGDPALMDVLKKCLTRDVQQRPTTEQLLQHPYLQKQSADAKSAPSLASKLNLLEMDNISGASPRTQQAFIKRIKELNDIASSLDLKLSQT